MAAPVRLAVMGAGLIGQAHIKRILEEPDAVLAGIADPAPQARAEAELLGVPWAADLATLLAAWAASQRVAGLRGFAADGLTRAFALAERSGDLWIHAFCLQKAAFLSHALGRDDQALAMIGQAAVYLTEVGGPEDLARLAVDRGCFSYYCGKIADARRLFEHRNGISGSFTQSTRSTNWCGTSRSRTSPRHDKASE